MKRKTGIELLQETQKGTKNSKKNSKKIDKIVKGVLVYWIIFVVVAWVTFWVKDSVPDTLIQYGLGGGAVELLVTGAIEIMRDKLNRRNDDE
jgi:hypothetical protein